MNSESTLLTIKEASAFLNVKVSRLRTAILTREIPYLKVGRLVRFDKNDLNSWIENLKDQTRKKSSNSLWF